jgi:hypothetical protein
MTDLLAVTAQKDFPPAPSPHRKASCAALRREGLARQKSSPSTVMDRLLNVAMQLSVLMLAIPSVGRRRSAPPRAQRAA